MAKPEPTHVEFQEQVVALAHLLGWRHLHIRRTIGRGKKWVTSTNVIGWPDLVCYHPTRGGLVALELKVGKDTLSPDQATVLAELRSSGMAAYVVYPADFEALTTLLTYRRGPQRGSSYVVPHGTDFRLSQQEIGEAEMSDK